nr:AraC family transcriptional regulator [Microvirga lupini]
MDFIDDNIHRQITLAELAAAANLSAFHFARRFKAATGQTPLRFIAERRVVEAKKRLRSGVMPLAQVALECGYTGQSHFTTAFKAVTGVTPGIYRRGAQAVLIAGLLCFSLMYNVATQAGAMDVLMAAMHEFGHEVVEFAVDLDDFLEP